MCRILITGAAGNVGTSLCEFLADKYDVVGTYNNREPQVSGVEFVKCNLFRDNLETILPSNVDIIVHVAAKLSGSTEELVDNNINATQNLVNYAINNKIKNIIYLSTVSVFGQTGDELNENSPIVNPEIYGMTKFLCEQIIKESAIEHKMIVRLPRVLGKYMDLSVTNSGFIKMINAMIEDKDITCDIPEMIYTNYITDDILVDFLAKQIGSISNLSDCIEVNLGTVKKITMLELLTCLRDGMESKAVINTACREGVPNCSTVNIDRAVELGLITGNEEESLVCIGSALKKNNR